MFIWRVPPKATCAIIVEPVTAMSDYLEPSATARLWLLDNTGLHQVTKYRHSTGTATCPLCGETATYWSSDIKLLPDDHVRNIVLESGQWAWFCQDCGMPFDYLDMVQTPDTELWMDTDLENNQPINGGSIHGSS